MNKYLNNAKAELGDALANLTKAYKSTSLINDSQSEAFYKGDNSINKENLLKYLSYMELQMQNIADMEGPKFNPISAKCFNNMMKTTYKSKQRILNEKNAILNKN